MKISRSRTCYKKAVRYMPGGVNSPVRAFKAVGGKPLFISKAKGSNILDVDGNRFIDYLMSWGALILGHSAKAVTGAIRRQAAKGTSYGAPTAAETELSQIVCSAVPSVKKVRFVNSGTEAVMSAIRLSRAFTKRDMVLKFSGNYHGHFDPLLIKAGSGNASFGIPSSAGITKKTATDTIVCEYNDKGGFKKLVQKHHKKIACVIVEPVCGNMGVVLPQKGFLELIRSLTKRHKIVLIFDEVITGFRFHFGGFQSLFGIEPDLTCLGKIIGSGLPIGAYGGRKEIMEMVSPLGPVYQAGTLSGNPIAVSAGLAAMKELQKKDYISLIRRAGELCEKMREVFNDAGIKATINQIGPMFTVFFNKGPVIDFSTAQRSDTKMFARYFHLMLKQGIYLPPSQFEANFVSFSHSKSDIKRTVTALIETVKELKRK